MHLLGAVYEAWRVMADVDCGMRCTDPRIDGIDVAMARLRRWLVAAEGRLEAQLLEFACERPIELNGFTGVSGHEIVMTWAAGVVELKWSTAGFRAFFKRFYGKGGIDWEAAKRAKDKTMEGVYEFWCPPPDWARHRAVLKIEYAKAAKLLGNPRVEARELLEIEATIVEAVGTEVMVAEAISRKAGYPNNSNFRTRLCRMVENGQLEKAKPYGYRLGPMSEHCQG